MSWYSASLTLPSTNQGAPKSHPKVNPPRFLYFLSMHPRFLLILFLPPPNRRHRKVARRHLRHMPTPSRGIPRALECAPTNTGSKTQTQTRRTGLGSPLPCRTTDTPPSRSEPRTLLARLGGAVVEAVGAEAVISSMMSPPVVQRVGYTN